MSLRDEQPVWITVKANPANYQTPHLNLDYTVFKIRKLNVKGKYQYAFNGVILN